MTKQKLQPYDEDFGDEKRDEHSDEDEVVKVTTEYSIDVVNYNSKEHNEHDLEKNRWTKHHVSAKPIYGASRRSTSRRCEEYDDDNDDSIRGYSELPFGSKVRGIVEAYHKAVDMCQKEYNGKKNNGVWYTSSSNDGFFYRVATIFLTELMRDEVLSNTKRKEKHNAALNSLNEEAQRLLPHLFDAWNEGALNSSQTAPEPAVFLVHDHRRGGRSCQASSSTTTKIIEIKQLVNKEGKHIIPFNDLFSRVHNIIPNVVKILQNLKGMDIIRFHYCGNGCCRFAYKMRRRDIATNKVVAYMTSGKFDVHDIVANLNESYIIINDWDALKEAIANNNNDNGRCCGSDGHCRSRKQPLLLKRDDTTVASSTTVVDFKDRKGVSWINPANKVAEIRAIIELSPSLRDMPDMQPLVAELDRIVTKVL